MFKWANRLFTCIVIALGGVNVYFLCSRGVAASTQEFSYQDLVTILLTALGIILAATTIFLGVLALWGYNSIRQAAIDLAEKAARDVARQVAKQVAREVAEPIATRASTSASEMVEDGAGDRLEAELMGGKDG